MYKIQTQCNPRKCHSMANPSLSNRTQKDQQTTFGIFKSNALNIYEDITTITEQKFEFILFTFNFNLFFYRKVSKRSFLVVTT